MIAVLPEANGPCSSVVLTFGFHSPQGEVSDQIFQTLSAGAGLTTEVPYSAMCRFYSPNVTSTRAPLGYGIDFGTSNSAISIAYADRVDVLALGAAHSSLTLPSFVYLHRSGAR